MVLMQRRTEFFQVRLKGLGNACTYYKSYHPIPYATPVPGGVSRGQRGVRVLTAFDGFDEGPDGPPEFDGFDGF